MSEIGERLENIRRLRMWTQARLAREAGVSPTTVSGIETGKIGRPHFGTLGKLALALSVAPEELLGSREPAQQQGPAPLSLGWARESGEGEFEHGLECASLESLDSLSRGLEVEQERLQRLYGEFPEASEQGRFLKRQIREVAGRSGSVKASAMVRRNQSDARRTDGHAGGAEPSSQGRSASTPPTRLGSRSLTHHPRTGVGRGWPVWSRSRSERCLPLSRTSSPARAAPTSPTEHDNPRLVARTGAVVLAVGIIHESPIAVT
jgi:transcriptional regulator with XRE-family HTH domain